MHNSKISRYPIPYVCNYCGSTVILGSNAMIYGQEYGNGLAYMCTSCDAYVGVHKGTDIPLGRLANRELRTLKKRCHAYFDPVWKYGTITRRKAYARLAELLGIPENECHFGWFDKAMLLKCLKIFIDAQWYREAQKGGPYAGRKSIGL